MDATDFQRLYNSNNPISNAEAEFINQERDLIPVVPIIRSPLWRFIDRFPNLRQISRFGDRKVRVLIFCEFDSHGQADTALHSATIRLLALMSKQLYITRSLDLIILSPAWD